MRANTLISIVCLLAVLALSACAGNQPSPDSLEADRDCLWVLWIKDQQQAREAAAQVARGRNMTMVARDALRQGADKATLDTGCPTPSELPLAVIEAARHLPLGQVSPLFSLRGGWAMVMRGTDRHYRKSLASYRAKRFQEAQEAAAQDLAINPSNTASWLLLGQSRAAMGDIVGANKAFDNGLLIDRQNPEIHSAKQQLSKTGHAPQILPPPPSSAPRVAQETGPAGQSSPVPPPPPASATAPGANAVPNPPLATAIGAPPETSSEDALEARQLLDSARHSAKDMNDPELAERQVLKATKLDPKLAGAWLLLGKLQEAKGQIAEATISYHQAASLEPSLEEANSGLRRGFLALEKERVARMDGPDGEESQRIPRGTLPDAPKKTIPRGKLPDAAVTNAKAVASSVDFFVQVASVQSQAAAQPEVRKWTTRGYRIKVWNWEGSDGTKWLRVLIGPYPTHDQAKSVGEKLKGQGVLPVYSVVELPRR